MTEKVSKDSYSRTGGMLMLSITRGMNVIDISVNFVYNNTKGVSV